jgi:hypothetical protein
MAYNLQGRTYIVPAWLALLHSRQTFLRSYTIAKDCINKNTYNLFDGKDEHSIANAENS